LEDAGKEDRGKEEVNHFEGMTVQNANRKDRKEREMAVKWRFGEFIYLSRGCDIRC
jgi:hypothetical protein